MPKYLYRKTVTCSEIGMIEALSPEAAKLLTEELDKHRDAVSHVRVAYETRITVGDETPIPQDEQ